MELFVDYARSKWNTNHAPYPRGRNANVSALELATLNLTVGSLWPWPMPMVHDARTNNAMPVGCSGSKGFTAENLTAAASARAAWSSTPAFHACLSATGARFCAFASAAIKHKW